MESNYTVKPDRKGKHTVTYECARCRAPLESPLQEAGESFPCPTCGAKVQTPGTEELRKHRMATEQQRIEEGRRSEAERASKEIAEARTAAEMKAKTASEQASLYVAPPAKAAKAAKIAWQISPLAFAVTFLTVLLIFYFAAVWPLQVKLSETRAKLNDTVNALAETRADLDSLTRTVNHNADVQNYNNTLR